MKFGFYHGKKHLHRQCKNSTDFKSKVPHICSNIKHIELYSKNKEEITKRTQIFEYCFNIYPMPEDNVCCLVSVSLLHLCVIFPLHKQRD